MHAPLASTASESATTESIRLIFRSSIERGRRSTPVQQIRSVAYRTFPNYSEVEAHADGVDGHAVVDLEILVGDQPVLEQALNERAFIDVEFDARLRTGQPRIISPVSIPAKAADKGLETPERRLQVDRSSRRVLEIIVHMTAEGCEKGLT